MAVPIAFLIAVLLGYKASEMRWPFVFAGAAVATELIVNGVRFGFETVIVWGLVLSALTVAAGFVGLRVGAWLRQRKLGSQLQK